MADRTPLTPNMIARRMRVPEDDPNYVNDPYRAMLAPLLVYGGGLGRLGVAARAAEAAAPAAETVAAAPAARQAFTYAFPRQLTAEELAAMRSAWTGSRPTAAAAEGAPSLSLADRLRAALTASARATNPFKVAVETTGTIPPSAGAPAASTSPLSDGTIAGEQYGERANYLRDRGLSDGSITGETYGMRAMPRDVMPPRRPVMERDRTPIDLTSGQQAAPSNLLSKIFSGKDYQSNAELVNKPMGGAPVNWGSSDSAADFFRADKALREQRPEMFERQAEARGGAPKPVSGNGGKDAALHKALEIIHHLLTRGR